MFHSIPRSDKPIDPYKQDLLGPRREEVLQALISQPTVSAAAIVLRITEQTLYRVMRDPSFSSDYRQARMVLMTDLVKQQLRRSHEAVAFMADLLKEKDHKKASAADKIKACIGLLDQVHKNFNALEIAEKLEAIERRLEEAEARNGRLHAIEALATRAALGQTGPVAGLPDQPAPPGSPTPESYLDDVLDRNDAGPMAG